MNVNIKGPSKLMAVIIYLLAYALNSSTVIDAGFLVKVE